MKKLGIQISNERVSRVAEILVSNSVKTKLSSNQKSCYIADNQSHLIHLQLYYSSQKCEYFDKMNEIIQMNKGVWFFKNKKWKKAQDIWKKIEHKNKKMNSSITSDIFKPVFFPISLAWNQALLNYMTKDYKTVLVKLRTVIVLLQT